MNMHVIFVAPFCMETTLRFVRGAAGLPDVNLSLVSQEGVEKLPLDLRSMLAGHWRVHDALDPEQLVVATRALESKLGPATKLIGALEQLQVPLAKVRETLGIEGLGVEAARNFRDKAQMKDVLRQAGVPCARHVLAHSPQQARAFVEETGFPVVAKPPSGAGGKGTYRVESLDDLHILLTRYPPSTSEPTMLEEFVSGTEHSFDSIMIKGKPVWHSISRYMPAPLKVLENSWIQWCVFLPRDISGDEFAPIRQVGFKAVEALGLRTGLSHMEWFQLQGERIAISEVGARPPGAQITSLLSWAHDLDFYRAWPRLMILDEFEPPVRKYAVGAAYFRGQRSESGGTRVRAIHGLEEAQRRFGPLVVEARLPTAGQFVSDSYEGEGYVIIRDEESNVVEEALQQIVKLVHVEIG